MSAWPNPRYAWYVTILLAFAYVVSYVDRVMLALLVKPIRAQMQISDTEMSLLLGISFALFFAVMGLPLGRLADRFSRRALIAAGIAIWSVMTIASGLAGSYGQLLLARAGVAIGEAALSPAALSMISDYFPPAKRVRAISIFLMGGNIGGAGGFIAGAGALSAAERGQGISWPLVGVLESWQLAFVIVGLPGLLLAALMATVREPVRQGVAPGSAQTSLRDVFAFLRQHRRAFVALFGGVTAALIVNFGYIAWGITMLSRVFEWTPARAGVVFGSASLVAAAVAPLMASSLGNALIRRGHVDGLMRAACWLACAAITPLVVGPLLGNPYAAIAVILCGLTCAAGMTILAQIAIQSVVSNRMRGTAIALYYLVLNIIGLGTGPTLVALLTDHVMHDENRMNVALALVAAVALSISIIVLARGLGAFRRLARAASAAEHRDAQPA